MEILSKGIDVSHWQEKINWYAVKKSGIDFAIIKAGGSDDGFYKDSKFEENYSGAKANGVNVGAYYFVGPNFISIEDGIADANRFIELLDGKSFEYPVVVDVESTNPSDIDGVTEATIAFCDTMEDAGYFVSIYASDISGFKERLDDSKLVAYDHWVARYGNEPVYVENYGMWQYSSSGFVTGINGRVDLDYSYKNYPEIMSTNKLNKIGIEEVDDMSGSTGNGNGAIVSGSKVKVINSINYDGTEVKAWFNDEGYDVGELKNDRAVLYHDNTLFDAFHISDLELI